MKKYFTILIVLILCSCTSLRVQVSTANPDSLKQIAKKIDPYQKLAFEYKKTLSILLNSDIITKRSQLLKEFDDALTKEIATGKTDLISTEVLKSNFNTNYTSAIDAILEKFNNANISMTNKQYEDAVNIYLTIPNLFLKLTASLQTEGLLDNSIERDKIVSDTFLKINKVNTVFHSGKANLLGDEIVSYITMKENDSIWKSTYNRTVSRTYYGNADIAIILNELPDNYNNNYSIKGVRVDAAKLIQSSFDVMTQVVNVAATMSGIVPASNGDSNSFYPDEYEEIKLLPSKTIALENKKELYNESKKQLLLRILGENLERKRGDDLKKSVADIQEYWELIKVNLEQ